MKVKFLVSNDLIPNDGSREILKKWENKDNKHTQLYVYPDVHYKKGAQVTNGLIICSDKYIYPACLGTENCGFTFGKIFEKDEAKLIESFQRFSQKLKTYDALNIYSEDIIKCRIYESLENDFNVKRDLYEYLDITKFSDLCNYVEKLLTPEIIEIIKSTLGAMGGGNHFFEIHKVDELFYENTEFKEGDYYFALHSDSIRVGWLYNVLFSNLSEMGRWIGPNFFNKIKMRKKQKQYFSIDAISKKCRKELKLMMNSKDQLREIDFETELGKKLLLEHNFASVFGEINRNEIIDGWCKLSGIKIGTRYSHSHDSISVEKIDNKLYVIHRNGVQRVGNDPYYFLPSAMGNYSYFMKNPQNKEAFFSANHGTGRLQDKHVAKELYSEEETKKQLEQRDVMLFKIGRGDLSEQNLLAFKEPQLVIDEMKKQGLGEAIARTTPIAVIKG